MITINGERKEYDKSLSIREYLMKEGYRIERIAVEVNEEIVPKSQYDTRHFNDEDKIEVINFVGGG